MPYPATKMPSSDSQKPIDLVDQARPATSRNFEAKRNTRVDANAAFPITDEILDRYLTTSKNREARQKK